MNTYQEVVQENSDLIYEIAVNIDRLQRSLLGVGGSLDNTEFPNGPASTVFWADGTKTVVKANPDNFICLFDEVVNQNSELKSISEIVNFIKDRLLG